jgi:hypothetical protein
MHLHTISKGVVINFILELLLMVFLVTNKFEISSNVFTIVMIVTLFIVSLYIGYSAKTNPQLHGFFVGLVSAVLLILSLFITVEMNWELNGIITVIWSFIGFIGAWIGGKMDISKVTLRRKQKLEKKQQKA